VQGGRFSHDSARVVTWGSDYKARLWKVEDGFAVGEPFSHAFGVQGARFNAAGGMVLTWGGDKTVRLWSAADGAPSGAPLLHGGSVLGALFNRDESLILSWSADNTVRLWRTLDSAPVGEPFRHDSTVTGAVFDRDEHRVLSWSTDNTARVWNLEIDADFPQRSVPLMLEVMTATALDASGSVVTLDPAAWERKRKQYVTIAQDHLTECRYKGANLYARQRELWTSR
jgi:hypothetical protein